MDPRIESGSYGGGLEPVNETHNAITMRIDNPGGGDPPERIESAPDNPSDPTENELEFVPKQGQLTKEITERISLNAGPVGKGLMKLAEKLAWSGKNLGGALGSAGGSFVDGLVLFLLMLASKEMSNVPEELILDAESAGKRLRGMVKIAFEQALGGLAATVISKGVNKTLKKSEREEFSKLGVSVDSYNTMKRRVDGLQQQLREYQEAKRAKQPGPGELKTEPKSEPKQPGRPAPTDSAEPLGDFPPKMTKPDKSQEEAARNLGSVEFLVEQDEPVDGSGSRNYEGDEID